VILRWRSIAKSFVDRRLVQRCWLVESNIEPEFGSGRVTGYSEITTCAKSENDRFYSKVLGPRTRRALPLLEPYTRLIELRGLGYDRSFRFISSSA
jgi:hypothetical protein